MNQETIGENSTNFNDLATKKVINFETTPSFLIKINAGS